MREASQETARASESETNSVDSISSYERSSVRAAQIWMAMVGTGSDEEEKRESEKKCHEVSDDSEIEPEDLSRLHVAEEAEEVRRRNVQRWLSKKKLESYEAELFHSLKDYSHVCTDPTPQQKQWLANNLPPFRHTAHAGVVRIDISVIEEPDGANDLRFHSTNATVCRRALAAGHKLAVGWSSSSHLKGLYVSESLHGSLLYAHANVVGLACTVAVLTMSGKKIGKSGSNRCVDHAENHTLLHSWIFSTQKGPCTDPPEIRVEHPAVSLRKKG